MPIDDALSVFTSAEPLSGYVTVTLALSKGLPDSSNRATCTADHLPPRAAGMPRSPIPAAMARNDVAPPACAEWH
jgi:hypothetical protein